MRILNYNVVKVKQKKIKPSLTVMKIGFFLTLSKGFFASALNHTDDALQNRRKILHLNIVLNK
jgi:hypothetical protein